MNESEKSSHVVSLETPNQSKGGLGRALKTGVLLAGAVAGAVAATNAVIAWNTPPLGGALGGGFNRYPARYGDIAYFVSGSGAPLLLLHALEPGNSCAEWEKNFEALAEKYTVYAPDFLGWGLSDKPPHFLRPQDYAEQIVHFATDVIGASQSTPCAVIASGEACAMALRAASESPALFSRFVFICPTTGAEYSADQLLEQLKNEDGEDEAAKPDPADDKSAPYQHPLYRMLTLPIVGRALLNALTSRARFEETRKHLFFNEEAAGQGIVSRLHIAAHQPGTDLTLAARFAGVLNAPWRQAWEKLAQPALLVWGRNAGPEGFETAPEWLALKPDADLEVFDECLLLPHVEHAEEFNARVLAWLQK
jgi:pimeloyl-ACP methyl ester carboxylesterase